VQRALKAVHRKFNMPLYLKNVCCLNHHVCDLIRNVALLTFMTSRCDMQHPPPPLSDSSQRNVFCFLYPATMDSATATAQAQPQPPHLFKLWWMLFTTVIPLPFLPLTASPSPPSGEKTQSDGFIMRRSILLSSTCS
jgi:hypothetical protein